MDNMLYDIAGLIVILIIVGILLLRSNNAEQPPVYPSTVDDDIDADTLEKSPGWVSDSSLPGNSGMSIIFGHRNRKHLKLIEPIEVGDTISFRFVSDNRLVSYEVTDVQIFEKTSDWTLPVTDEDVLVLVTCYPFEYTGNAPGKFQVIARLSKNLSG